MRKEARLTEMRREMGAAHYYAWRVSCKCHVRQKYLDINTVGNRALWKLYEAVGTVAWALADFTTSKVFKGLRDALIGLTAILATVIVMTACADMDTHQQYPATLKVVDVQEYETGDYVVTLRTAEGLMYTYSTDDGDFWPGEAYSCIMDDNGTHRAIADDRIVSVKYTSWEVN